MAYDLIILFGGNGSCSYLFEKNSTRYSSMLNIIRDVPTHGNAAVVAEEDTLIDEVVDINNDTCMSFEYDFEDSWKITLVFEGVVYDDSPRFRLIDGAGLGLLEDCGGPIALSKMDQMHRDNPEAFIKEYGDWLESVHKINPKKIDFHGKINSKSLEKRVFKEYPVFVKCYESPFGKHITSLVGNNTEECDN